MSAANPYVRNYGALTDADTDLIADCIRERKRLRVELRTAAPEERERIRRDLLELSDESLAKKFGEDRNVIRRVSKEVE